MSDTEAGSVRIVLHNFQSEVEAPVGTTLLEAVQAAGLGLDAEYRAHAPGKPGRPRKVRP